MSVYKNVLEVVQQNDFRMPNFGKRVSHLQDQLEEMNRTEPADVIQFTENSTSKMVHKVADSIGEGTIDVEPHQHDLTGKNINSIFLNLEF